MMIARVFGAIALSWVLFTAVPSSTADVVLSQVDRTVLTKLGWPPIAQKVAGDTCPDLSGVYVYDGEESFALIDDGTLKGPATTRSTTPVFFFGHPRTGAGGPDLRRREPATVAETVAPRRFWVKQSPEQVVFRRIAPNNASAIEFVALQRSAGDFRCEAGLLLVVPTVGGGFTDGSATEYRAATILGKLEDGSLFRFHSTYYSSTSFLIFRGTRQTASYARFRPVDA